MIIVIAVQFGGTSIYKGEFPGHASLVFHARHQPILVRLSMQPHAGIAGACYVHVVSFPLSLGLIVEDKPTKISCL